MEKNYYIIRHSDGCLEPGSTKLLSPEWVEHTNRAVEEKVSAGIYKCGFTWELLPEKPIWFGRRHVCHWRSICETMGINPKEPHCICGKQYDDPVHFKTSEINAMSQEEKLYI